MSTTDKPDLNLNVDLKQGMIPISKVASSLATLIQRARTQGQPIIITQKGYPSGVLIDVELFTALRKLAEEAAEDASQAGDA